MEKTFEVKMTKEMANRRCLEGCQVVVNDKYYKVKGGTYQQVCEHFNRDSVDVVDEYGAVYEVVK